MIELFISRFREEKTTYEAWGLFVTREILTNLDLPEEEKESFFKIPPNQRLKREASIRGKAERYGITDFDNNIQDLVGVRFVVLLTSDLPLIEEAIKKSIFFNSKKIRDYGTQAETNPELFEYQSIHYLISPKEHFTDKGISFGPELICEVQIRTLLQHAYAELTHDNIYKPVHVVPSNARRLVARSMALMEATDEIFHDTLETLKIANAPRNQLLNDIKKFYFDNVFSDQEYFDSKVNFEIIDLFKDAIDFQAAFEKIKDFFYHHPHLLTTIKIYRETNFLFSQPVVLLLFFIISNNDYIVKSRWNLESMSNQLSLIFSNLGISWSDDQ